MFSVVIPLYNKELSIGNTIQSVLDQTCQEFEIVVVNDGSTDDSLNRVYEFNDSRIRVINKENGGVSSARNVGIKEARSEWIAFLDGDDIWSTNHLSEIKLMMLQFPNYNMYVTSFQFSDKRSIYSKDRENSIFVIDNLLDENPNEYLVWTSIVVVNKISIIEVGGFNEKVSRGEDLDLWQRLGFKNCIVKSTNITCIYNISAENRSDVSKYNVCKSILYHYKLRTISSNHLEKFEKRDVKHSMIVFLLRFDFESFVKLLVRYKFKLIFW